MKRGVAIKKGLSVVLCHVRAMLYIRRGIYVSRQADNEDEERDGLRFAGNCTRQSRARYGVLGAFYLKSVTKRSSSSNSPCTKEKTEIERENKKGE